MPGPRKVGKSALMFNLTGALSLTRVVQDPATGQPVWQPGRFLGAVDCWLAGTVAYLNLEMDADDWRDEFRKMPRGSYDPARIVPLHLRGVPFPVVTSTAARAWFTGWLRANAVEVLIIDTWGAFGPRNGARDLNKDSEVRPVLDGLDEIRAEAGVRSLYMPIHMPHQTGDPGAERFKGAGMVGDWADALWNYVQPDPKDETRFLGAHGRARIDMPESALAYDYCTGLCVGGRQPQAAGPADRSGADYRSGAGKTTGY